ncbi:MAG TPA: hydantoinase B/oxoprolinase family protein [Candidatus Binataceae bacterium]|nr:hydantoinase B/oxoprolinase family protein [Candidatus Binataceae bacterium]
MRDPFLPEIIHNALRGIADEAGLFSARSAYSPFVNTSPQIAAGLFDAKARPIAQTDSALIHVSAVQRMLPEVLHDIPVETLAAGDALIINDHFRGGIHPTDVAVFTPIFYKGKLAFFHGAMMIVSDLGGLSNGGLPANATEIFHEGLVIPPVKLYKQGVPNEEVHRMIASNSRTPARVLGDVRALVVGGNMSAPRLVELCDKYGYEQVMEIIDELLDYTERLTRQGIERIPDGVYTGSYVIEDDGIEVGKHFKVQVAVTVAGSNIKLDFTGTDPQARGPINSSYSQSLSGVVVALRFFLDPDIPLNEGFYRPIEVVFPHGSLVNPKYPAAANARFAVVQSIMDAINQALSVARPDKLMAPSGCPHVFTVTGIDPQTNQFWSMLDVHMGVLGARAGKDGIDGLPPLLNATPGYMRNAEHYEWEYPVMYDYFAFRPDTAGPGKWRGSAGMIKHVTFNSDADLTVRAVDRCNLPPRGAAGGLPGGTGGWVLNEGLPGERRLPMKQTNLRIRAGDTLTMYVSGGGGYGDPLTRDPELVGRDVRKSLVSVEGAARDYGVVADSNGVVDRAKTRKLRVQRQSE